MINSTKVFEITDENKEYIFHTKYDNGFDKIQVILFLDNNQYLSDMIFRLDISEVPDDGDEPVNIDKIRPYFDWNRMDFSTIDTSVHRIERVMEEFCSLVEIEYLH